MKRIHELDAVRGFALAGITFMNVLQMTGMPQPEGRNADHLDSFLFQLAFDQRFAPTFAVLFGMSFALFLNGSAASHPRPRVLLVRRLVTLTVLGLAHALLQPGEVLRFYGVFGLLFLVPASFLARRWVLSLGVVALVVPVVLASLNVFLLGPFPIPGLLLLGMAAVRYDLLGRMNRPAVVLALLVLAVPAGIWQFHGGAGLAGVSRAQLTGLVFAPLFAMLFLLRPWRFFEPMGRMALTNYLLATLLILAVGGLVTGYASLVLCGLGIVVVQAVLSHLWTRRFRYGPAEWAWRCVTWWRVIPFGTAPSTGSPSRTPGSPEAPPSSGAARPR
ncbi:DUF418 domain-containing protein [Lentzea sp. NPDC058436]|uniref:DUF418 domain-containing protein n=1 Tax=Lentzea sp. NPDC058436 TaxID=3346499 RepID=UPI003662271F